jgi:DHA1 family bicyclomycin/chloramphenicol resistance-like MFS transporter
VQSSLGFVLPNSTALALRDHPRVAGSASALLGVLQYLIAATVAPLVGLVGTSSAVPMAIVIATLAASAVLVRLGLVGRYSARA